MKRLMNISSRANVAYTDTSQEKFITYSDIFQKALNCGCIFVSGGIYILNTTLYFQYE